MAVLGAEQANVILIIVVLDVQFRINLPAQKRPPLAFTVYLVAFAAVL